MTLSRSDRPYGSFPGLGTGPVGAPDAPTPPRRRRAARIWRRVATPLLLVALLGLSWVLVDAMRAGALNTLDAVPVPRTPAPTTPLAAAVYQHVAPSVVQVTATLKEGGPLLGSGVIVDEQAHVLTSLHLVRDATRVLVRFADGSQAAAAVIAVLAEKDIAVLMPQTAPARVVPATLGDPTRLAVGEPAFAIGSPYGLTGSLSAGVISGLDRSLTAPGQLKPLTGLIQFDAAINPGSSGGPLVDSRGEVVGIVTGLANPSGQKANSGVGFAVTIDQAAGALGLPPD